MNAIKIYKENTKGKIEAKEKDVEDLSKRQEEATKLEIERLEREKWLSMPHTKMFLKYLEEIGSERIATVLHSANLSTDSFSEIGKSNAIEAAVIGKVISYARTGKYESE